MSAQPSWIASPPFRALDRDFFARDPRRVARDLLSKVLVRSLEAENPGGKGALLVALNKKNGKVIWKCDAPVGDTTASAMATS